VRVMTLERQDQLMRCQLFEEKPVTRRQNQLANGEAEARSLEYTTPSVSQNILFRYSLSMRNLGLIVYGTLKK
jgi:hypothetical protein